MRSVTDFTLQLSRKIEDNCYDFYRIAVFTCHMDGRDTIRMVKLVYFVYTIVGLL